MTTYIIGETNFSERACRTPASLFCCLSLDVEYSNTPTPGASLLNGDKGQSQAKYGSAG